jgi:hypothetical protein
MAATLLLLACGGDGDADGDLTARVEQLVDGDAETLAADLATQGTDVGVDVLRDTPLDCPTVEPDPGDLATCRGELEGGPVEVTVEAGPDGDLTLIGIVAPVLAP